MNSRTATTQRILSAILLAAAAGPVQARLGYFAAVQLQPAADQREALPQPVQTEPERTFSTDGARSPITSERAVPLGGNTPDQQFLPGTLTVSPDSSNVAYRLRYGNGLGFDGYIYGGHKPIGASRATDPSFAPDSKTLAVVLADRGWKLRLGKTFIEGFEPVTAPRFSPDGRRVIYLARMENQRFLVEGDRPHPIADTVVWDQLVFTPDSAVVAYPAFDGQDWRMVINGDPGPTWDSFTTPPLTALQGSRVVYIATKKGRYHVVDRHTPAPTDSMSRVEAGFRLIDRPPVFSADGQAFAYWALGDDLVWRVYQNHVYVPGYDADRPGQLLLNEDGQVLIAILKRGEHWHVVRDGVMSPPYIAVGNNSLVLSPDGSRLVYAVQKPGGWAVVEDGTEHPTYTSLAAHSLRFSPDSQRFVYVALSLGQWSAIVDGQPQQTFNKITTPSITFSPDSRRIAYVGYDAGTAHVVIDGEAMGGYDHADRLAFSPDSRHLVWVATNNDQSFLVVNGTPSTEAFDEPVPGSHIHFVNNLLCHTAVVRRPGPTFARIELKLSVPDEASAPGSEDRYSPDAPDTAPTTPGTSEPASPFVEVPTE